MIKMIKTLVPATLLCWCKMSAAMESDLVCGIAANELFRETLGYRAEPISVDMWGVNFTLMLDGHIVGRASIGVFSSKEEARRRFEHRLQMTAVAPTTSVVPTIGDVSVSWDASRILFVRDNCMVNLQLANPAIEDQSRAIDLAIVQGVSGVSRGESVHRPTIEDIISSGTLRPKWLARTNPPMQGYTSLVDVHGAANESSPVRVVFATLDCVMAEPMDVTSATLALKRNPPPSPEEARAQAEARQRRVDAAIATLVDTAAAPDLRSKAAVELMNLADPAAVPYLLDVLAHDPKDNLPLHQNAIRALGAIRDRRAVPALMAILEAPVRGDVADEGDAEGILRREAVKALDRIDDPAMVPLLRRLLESPREHPAVRAAAGQTLLRVLGPEGGAR